MLGDNHTRINNLYETVVGQKKVNTQQAEVIQSTKATCTEKL